MGPTCRYSTTIEVAYPIRRLPPEVSGPASRVGRSSSPSRAGGTCKPVPLSRAGRVVGGRSGGGPSAQVRCGLHHAVGGRRPADVERPAVGVARSLSKPAATRGDLASLREAGLNLVARRCRRPARLVRRRRRDRHPTRRPCRGRGRPVAGHHPPLRHPSLLGFMGSADSGGPLYLTGGRGMLELVPETDA